MLWIQPADWPAALAALDHQEGYDPADHQPLFVRVVRSVETADGPVECWVYLAGRLLAAADRPVVTGGDWVAYCADRADYRAHWESIADAGGRAERP